MVYQTLEDLDIPAKRRLLYRPNVKVYVGDLQDLLLALNILDNKVAIESMQLKLG